MKGSIQDNGQTVQKQSSDPQPAAASPASQPAVSQTFRGTDCCLQRQRREPDSNPHDSQPGPDQCLTAFLIFVLLPAQDQPTCPLNSHLDTPLETLQRPSSIRHPEPPLLH